MNEGSTLLTCICVGTGVAKGCFVCLLAEVFNHYIIFTVQNTEKAQPENDTKGVESHNTFSWNNFWSYFGNFKVSLLSKKCFLNCLNILRTWSHWGVQWLMKGTEVPNCRRSSACDCTCVLTRNRSLSCDYLMLAMPIVLFLPMQSSLTSFWHSFTGLVQLIFSFPSWFHTVWFYCSHTFHS